jgi:hypothetical protein
VKVLRTLQVELQERTRQHQQRLAGLDAPLGKAEQAVLEREARELAAEQQRLAQLVEDMLSRDNKDDEL